MSEFGLCLFCIIHLIRQERDVFVICLHSNMLLFLVSIYICRLCQMDKKVETNNSICQCFMYMAGYT